LESSQPLDLDILEDNSLESKIISGDSSVRANNRRGYRAESIRSYGKSVIDKHRQDLDLSFDDSIYSAFDENEFSNSFTLDDLVGTFKEKD
jgi:hypothetical protein